VSNKAAKARRPDTVPNTLRRSEVLSAFDRVMAELLFLAGDIQPISREAVQLVRSAADLLQEGRTHCENVLRPDGPS
jgi:hypothetical protein